MRLNHISRSLLFMLKSYVNVPKHRLARFTGKLLFSWCYFQFTNITYGSKVLKHKKSWWRKRWWQQIRNMTWWRHQIKTFFRVIGPLCGEFTGPVEFPAQRSVTRSFDVFFDLRLNKRLSKQPWGWWFETPSWSLWRQCNNGADP